MDQVLDGDEQYEMPLPVADGWWLVASAGDRCLFVWPIA